jgi:hypothetical protein
VFPTVQLALLRATRRAPERFRVVHFSVQRDHVHLVVEAIDRRALTSGLSGLMIRIARYVNELLSRRGPVWADRFHTRALTSPREVRRALVYVLANARKHAAETLPAGIDPYSSALWFDGWQDCSSSSGVPPPFLVRREWRDDALERASAADFAPRTWLCKVGWRRLGRISLTESPARN